MSSAGAASRAAVPTSSARAEASRKNGAKSRGPKAPEGKARSSRNALKHGMRAQKYVVLPEEDAAEFAALEAALFVELAPVGALQAVLARRVVVAAWRLARADRIETELFEEHHIPGGSLGLALIRDGNGTRSFETLLRYRGAAMAEFWRALRTLKALQAEQAVETGAALQAQPRRPAARRPAAQRPQPSEPERGAGPRREYVVSEPPAPARTLPDAIAPWTPRRQGAERTPNEPEPHPVRGPDQGEIARPPAPAPSGMPATESQGRMDRLNKCRTHWLRLCELSGRRGEGMGNALPMSTPPW
ncbi:MAG: hypothetical protein ACREJ5_12810 [Geminicoccaceae bacterium]